MLVSVIIPAYNCERFLEEAVASVVRERDSADLEVVIVEDGSTDGTLELCRRLEARHSDLVRVFRHPEGANRGVSASRNLAVRESRGELICFLDADDYWLPGRLDAALTILRDRPEVEAVYEAVKTVFEDPSSQKDFAGPPGLMRPPDGKEGAGLFKSVLFGANWHTAGIVIRRSALEGAGLFPQHFSVGEGEDLHLWARVAASCTVVPGRTDEAVACYRRHDRNSWDPSAGADHFELFWDLCLLFERQAIAPEMRRIARTRLIRCVTRPPKNGALAENAIRLRRLVRLAWRYPLVFSHKAFYREIFRLLRFHRARRRPRAQ